MRTRTRLTTPPGREPAADEASRTPAGIERYRRFLSRPDEPRWPGRHRRPLLIAASVALVVLIGIVGYRLATAGQFQDPSLTEAPGQP